MSQTMREARDLYLARNGLSTDSYNERLFALRLGPLTLPLPNPGLLPLHDLHHVVTGYDTDVVGEAEISVYELVTGPRHATIAFLCLGAILFGVVLSPRRVWRSLARTRGLGSLYHGAPDYEVLLEADVESVRRALGMPAAGLAA